MPHRAAIFVHHLPDQPTHAGGEAPDRRRLRFTERRVEARGANTYGTAGAVHPLRRALVRRTALAFLGGGGAGFSAALAAFT